MCSLILHLCSLILHLYSLILHLCSLILNLHSPIFQFNMKIMDFLAEQEQKPLYDTNKDQYTFALINDKSNFRYGIVNSRFQD